jgi:hypothetical protein
VLSFDPRGTGETRMNYRTSDADDPRAANPLNSALANLVYNAQLLGRPYPLEMVEDVSSVARFAKERLGIGSLSVAGRGDARVVAALAADVLGLELIGGGELDWWARTVNDGREVWPIQCCIRAARCCARRRASGGYASRVVCTWPRSVSTSSARR